MLNANVPAWFEIPTRDLDRAQRFYETILEQPLRREAFGGGEMAVFPYGGPPQSSGALIRMPQCVPAMDGSTVYLSVEALAPVLARVEEAGGQAIVPRTEIPDGMGWFAQFRDSEGNRVGLWSPR